MLTSQVLIASLVCLQTWLVITDASWTCLRVCVCSTSSNSTNAITQVTCSAANISQLPRGLPSSVVFLDLTSNKIASLEAGSLGQLPELIHLRMRSNSLESIADGTFRNLPQLQTLDLGDNRLQRLGERTFQGLTNVETIDLSENALTSIDGAFTNMRHLTRLDLRRNNLTTLTRFSLRDLVNLQYLLLGDNRIATVERDAFRSLEKLMYLVLKGNPLAAVERLDITAPTLNFVDLSECGLQRLPKGLPSSIRYLQLRRNNITSLRKNAFIGCPYVGILILDENGLTTIENKTFIHMTYLQQLWLNGNHLTVIPSLLPSSIQRLYLDGNRVVSLTDVFPANSQIDTLSLMGNEIQVVTSEALRRLPKLRSLDLSNNRISELRGHTFSKSTQLRRLVLSKNPLQTFHHHSLRGLRALRSLALAHIPGDPSQPPGLVADLRQLRTLDFTNSPGLIQVFLDMVSAQKSPSSTSSPATALTTSSSASLSLLEELNLAGSQLTHIAKDTFNAFPALKTMQLSSTRFHCDISMSWLRDWLRSTRVHVADREVIACYSPRHLYLQPIISLRDDEFALATPTASASPSIKTTAAPRDDQSDEDLLPASGDGTDLNYNDNEGEGDSMADIIGRDEEVINDEIINPKDIDDMGKYASSTDGRLLPVLPDMTTPTVHSKVRSNSTSTTLSSTIKSTNHATSRPSGGEHDVDGVDDDNADEDDWGWDNPKSDKEINPNKDVDLANGTSVHEPVRSASTSHTTSAIIVALTAIATLGTAAFLIFLIVRLSKKQSKQRSANSVHANGNGNHSNGSSPIVKFSKKSNGLYVTGRPVNDYGPEPTAAVHTVHKAPRSVGGGSIRDIHNIHNTETLLSESMTLIPGRDINHEGPLRVYKWEEF